MLTYADLLDHVLAYSGTDVSAQASSRHRQAVQAAFDTFPNKHQWAYLWAVTRVLTSEPYSTGTVAYDHTGGASERMLTLTTGTWPSWAASGYVVIANVPYQVETRVSDTVVTLGENANPGADVAALTEYEILRDLYDLPVDFVSADEAIINDVGTVLAWQHPREWSSQRRTNTGPGQPWAFSLLGATNNPGRMRIALWPPPDAAYAIDILYRRRPRNLVYSDVSDGLVSGSAAGTTVTGSDTTFLALHVGSVIRIGTNNQDIPTGPRGNNPGLYEGTITAYTSATSIEVYPALPQAFDQVRFQISDPVDIDVISMSEYVLREVEKQYRMLARSKPTPEETPNYGLAFQQALEADNRYTGRQAAQRFQKRRSGLSHYPIDFGV